MTVIIEAPPKVLEEPLTERQEALLLIREVMSDPDRVVLNPYHFAEHEDGREANPRFPAPRMCFVASLYYGSGRPVYAPPTPLFDSLYDEIEITLALSAGGSHGAQPFTQALLKGGREYCVEIIDQLLAK